LKPGAQKHRHYEVSSAPEEREGMKLSGKVCLITGGTRGIGAATALALASSGADVAINGRVGDEEAYGVKASIEALGRRCYLHLGDVSTPAVAEEFVKTTAETLGGVDTLIHSAGGAAPGSLLEVDPAVWYHAFDIHIHAVFHLTRAAVPLMKQRHGGSIVLLSSVAGLRGCAGAIAYGAVKGALPQFARALAREFGDDNIRVNCVSPGIIRTRFQDFLTPEQAKDNIQRRIPLHREGTPADVAQVITTLVSNDFITGENIVIDGGMSMRMV
jgi:NAD(P)-dependent dehydrogenase (short-subunit alcohol dehydrogenase family)